MVNKSDIRSEIMKSRYETVRSERFHTSKLNQITKHSIIVMIISKI